MRRALFATLLCSLLASSLAAAPDPDCQVPPERLIAALNALRASSRSCGAGVMAAAAPLQWNDRLAASSRLYAEELARRDTISHEGLVWRTLGKRLNAAGYRMQMGGENLAAGQDELDDVLAQWMASRDHCENLMLPEFRDAGLACATGPGRYRTYWVLHLGLRSEARSSPDQ